MEDVPSTTVDTSSSSAAQTAAVLALRFVPSLIHMLLVGLRIFIIIPAYNAVSQRSLQDKAIARYLVKNIVEAAAVRDLTEASAYSGMLDKLRTTECRLLWMSS